DIPSVIVQADALRRSNKDLDEAEALLLGLFEREDITAEQTGHAYVSLISIYLQQRDWPKAVETAELLVAEGSGFHRDDILRGYFFRAYANHRGQLASGEAVAQMYLDGYGYAQQGSEKRGAYGAHALSRH